MSNELYINQRSYSKIGDITNVFPGKNVKEIHSVFEK